MNNNLKCVVVDDEPMAREILISYINKTPNLDLIETFKNASEALVFMQENTADVYFLDINMPEISGLTLAKIINKKSKIIFTTAYREYAVDGFKLQAVDYLLKPVEIKRLKESVLRLSNKLDITNNINYKTLSQNLKENNLSKIIVRQNGSQKILATKNIIAIEAKEAYSYIYTPDTNYLMSKNLKHFETILENNNVFFRSHKSWIINFDYIKNFSKSKLEIELNEGITAKLSKYKKPEFETKILTE